VSVLQSLGISRVASPPPTLAKESVEAVVAVPLAERIKTLGVAGTLSYVAVELAFWAVALPFAVFGYRAADGVWLSLGDVDDRAKLLGAGAAFISVVRLFVPLRLAAALALAPTVERLLSGGADVAVLKAAVSAAAGSRNGTDRSAEQAEQASASITALVRANPARAPAKADLRGTQWTLLYTDSRGNSSGRLGPWTGVVTQEFAEDGESYANVVRLGGLLELRLEASYEVKSNVLLGVQFESINVSIGGLRVLRKPFDAPNKPRGTWLMLYSDDDTRVLRVPETDNVFVLQRAV